MNSEETIKNLQEQINELTSHLKTLYDIQQNSTTATSSPPPPPLPKVKINPPTPFTGTRVQSKNFLGQCGLVFNTQPEIYNNEKKKINYACSYLRDNAFTWYLTSDLAKPDDKTTYAEFCELFLTAFGDVDLEHKAKMELRALKQRGSCVDYTTEFNRIAVNTLYNDAAKLDLYHFGLKEEVKDLLLTFEITTDLKLYQKNAIKCDERIYQRKLERKSVSVRRDDNSLGLVKNHEVTPSRQESYPSNDPSPMDIDSLKLVNGHLSEEQRRHRIKNNLCMYCGLEGHISRSCPKKSAGNARFRSDNGPSRTA